MNKFQLVLKNEKLKTYRMIRFILLLLNLGGMVLLLVQAETGRQMIWPIITIISISFFFLFTIIEFANHTFSYDGWPRLIYIWSAIAWLKTEFWWLAILLVGLAILDYLTHRRQVVTVSKEHISYPSLSNKTIEWDELSNIILKDGWLTIDFKNNKLIQYPVVLGDNEFREKDFNEFCTKRLG
ncbi:MAG: hypothetical protein H7Y42_05110 [Chitinophagaceae bacterium]|nr:hypothetical protein [Chitinophagaceae bacterium]